MDEPPPRQAPLAILVVNFRTPGRTIDCLKSLEGEIRALRGARVVVVENGSGDDSPVMLADAIASNGYSDWCTLIHSDENVGFARGNNLGVARVMAEGGARYFLLLNNDTIVEPGCLQYCVQAMESDPTVGALTCRLLNADGTVQNVCRRFPTPLRCLAEALSLPWRLPRLFSWADCEDLDWDRNIETRNVDWIGGAFMLLRGSWVARYGGLDGRFFFYGEDIEICHRIHRSNYLCRYDPGATVTHVGGASSDPTRMSNAARNFHFWRGRYLVQRICYGKTAELFVRSLDVLTASRRVVWSRLAGRAQSPTHVTNTETLRFLVHNWGSWGSEHAS